MPATPLHEATLDLLFADASSHLRQAIVTLDSTGGRQTQRRLGASLRERLQAAAPGSSHKVKFERSSGNNLLQLADYAVGLAARRHLGLRDGATLYDRYLRTKEASWREWP